MTVTKDISLLYSFKNKIDEAASFVPRMHATDKLKAVRFWNLISEKLQDIVNSTSTDINVIENKEAENEFVKMHLEMNNSRSGNTISNCNVSPEFISLSSSYGISTELVEQYHSVDVNNIQLLAPETFSVATESSLSSINSISQLPLNSVNSCEKNITDKYIIVDNLTENCDTLVLNSCLSPAPRNEEETKNNDYIPEEITENESSYQSSEVAEIISDHSYNLNDVPLASPDEELIKDKSSVRDSSKCSILKLSLLKDKNSHKTKNKINLRQQENNIPEDSESSKDSIKSDFNTTISTGESDSSHAEQPEPIVSFLVSCSEEVIAKNGPDPGLNRKCSENCIGHNCLHMKTLTCSYCPAKFATKGNLIVHLRKHTGEKPYSCSKCSSCFTTKGNLKRHYKTHTGERPFECTHCGGKFTERKSLNIHMRRHTGEKPYECKECGKKFAQSGILHTHMAVHLNQKLFLCEHCGKSFRQRSQLHIHKLRHDNIRKHGCTVCSSRFLTKGDLERHMRIHTGERPFVCSICSKKFTRQQSLNEHMNRHYGLEPYVCKFCDKSFSEMSAFYKHLKQHQKAAASISEKSQSSEPSKLSEETSSSVSHNTSLEMLKLTKRDSFRAELNELPSKDDSIDTNQNIVNYSYLY